MKNANVFVDVDLTLVDAAGKMLPGVAEALNKLQGRAATCSCGQRMVLITRVIPPGGLGLSEMFEGFAPKPDIIIDDMPATVLNPFVFDVNSETSWTALADKIISKHID